MAVPLPPLNLSAGGGGPSGASGAVEGMFDSSGWVVNFGAGSVESSRAEVGELTPYLPYVLAAAAVLIAWRFTKR